MSDRRRSHVLPHCSGANAYQQSIPSAAEDYSEPHDAFSGRHSHEQSQDNRARGLQASGQEVYSAGLGAYAARNSAYSTEVGANIDGQGGYNAEIGTYAAGRDANSVYQRTINVVHVNPQLNAGFGSQFGGHHRSALLNEDPDDTPRHPAVGSSTTTSHYASDYQPGIGSAYTRHQASLQNPDPSYQMNTTAYDPHWSISTTYPNTSNVINYAAPEPWASAHQSPYLNSYRSPLSTASSYPTPLRALYYSDAIDDKLGQKLSTNRHLLTSTPTPRQRSRMPSPDLASSSNTRLSGDLSQARSSVHYGSESLDETTNSSIRRPRQRAPSAAPPSVYYGQGRRETLELPVRQSGHRASSTDQHTPSQQGSLPYVRSATDTRGPYARSSRTLDHHSFTNTSTTNITVTSQGSRRGESAPRFDNLPNPLPCKHQDCPHTARGYDRITNMNRHVRERHEVNAGVRCPSCGKVYTRHAAVVRHRKSCRNRGES